MNLGMSESSRNYSWTLTPNDGEYYIRGQSITFFMVEAMGSVDLSFYTVVSFFIKIPRLDFDLSGLSKLNPSMVVFKIAEESKMFFLFEKGPRDSLKD